MESESFFEAYFQEKNGLEMFPPLQCIHVCVLQSPPECLIEYPFLLPSDDLEFGIRLSSHVIYTTFLYTYVYTNICIHTQIGPLPTMFLSYLDIVICQHVSSTSFFLILLLVAPLCECPVIQSVCCHLFPRFCSFGAAARSTLIHISLYTNILKRA